MLLHIFYNEIFNIKMTKVLKCQKKIILQQEFVEAFLTKRSFEWRELHLPCVHNGHCLKHRDHNDKTSVY